LWNAVSSLEDVEISVSFSGSAMGPSLRIGSNVGQVVAASLRRELGERIQQAEQMVRARVDELVDQHVGEAEAKLAALDSEVAASVGLRFTEVTDVRAELERALRRIIPRP
jgi:ABC-type phosphate transport system auxiliary subunit